MTYVSWFIKTYFDQLVVWVLPKFISMMQFGYNWQSVIYLFQLPTADSENKLRFHIQSQEILKNSFSFCIYNSTRFLISYNHLMNFLETWYTWLLILHLPLSQHAMTVSPTKSKPLKEEVKSRSRSTVFWN